MDGMVSQPTSPAADLRLLHCGAEHVVGEAARLFRGLSALVLPCHVEPVVDNAGFEMRADPAHQPSAPPGDGREIGEKVHGDADFEWLGLVLPISQDDCNGLVGLRKKVIGILSLAPLHRLDVAREMQRCLVFETSDGHLFARIGARARHRGFDLRLFAGIGHVARLKADSQATQGGR